MTQLKFCIVFALTLFIGYWFANSAVSSVGFYALVTLPGTFMHELAHYVSAAATNGDPNGFSIIPQADSLGRVLVRPNAWNGALIGLAPLTLAPLTLWFMVLAARASILPLLVFSYIAASCWAACLPSTADLSIALMYPTSWPFALIGLAVLCFVIFKMSAYMLRFK